jgi:hypothetical protein
LRGRAVIRRTVIVGVVVAAAFVLAAPALAVPPVITSLTQVARHPKATFTAPRAANLFIYFATKPDRATDGSFLQENIATSDFMTNDEIATGQWLSESQLDPGTYYVMLRATPDDSSCFDFNTGIWDPACADGYSDVVTLVVPKPVSRYSVSATAYRYLGTVDLRLTATSIGEKRPYRVCTTAKTGRRLCVPGVLDGYSWSSPASDLITMRSRTLPTLATFTWYIGAAKVGAKRVRVR